jgi:hypothetical protein
MPSRPVKTLTMDSASNGKTNTEISRLWVFIYLYTTGPELLASGFNAYPFVCISKALSDCRESIWDCSQTCRQVPDTSHISISEHQPSHIPPISSNPSLQYRPKLLLIPCKPATISGIHVRFPGECFSRRKNTHASMWRHMYHSAAF